MTIRFEVNPPKIIRDSIIPHDEINRSLEKLRQRVFEISAYCNGIHITDSVLGVTRISPSIVASQIRKDSKRINITTSLRVRDRNLISLSQAIYDNILNDVNGVLVVKGDPPPQGPKDSKLHPSDVVRHFNEIGINKKLDLFLSITSNPDFNKIQKKIDAEPTGFITQIVNSMEQVSKIVDKLKPLGFKIIPCVILPSEKNSKSANFLKLDWSEYKDELIDFIKKIHKISGDVLITSPNDFKTARETLAEISKFI
jgi:homocysteine S-methyltransferase